MNDLALTVEVVREHRESRRKKVEQVCRPDSVDRLRDLTIIPLGARLPGRSSHLPARRGGPPRAANRARAYLVLLRMGFGLPDPSPDPR